jgi:hypothetical protein
MPKKIRTTTMGDSLDIAHNQEGLRPTIDRVQLHNQCFETKLGQTTKAEEMGLDPTTRTKTHNQTKKPKKMTIQILIFQSLITRTTRHEYDFRF